ncbi:MAG: hypothetical protein KatS3mg082_2384 [Nitrospiraceae bacterium]|nr:MAG: hypothetical protein KatS3mg082_2384 [Nitrospiraceae bacterium]
MFKKAVQRGRSERRGEAYSSPYVEPLSDARTKLADFFNILLVLLAGMVKRRLGWLYGRPAIGRDCSEG